MKPDNKFASVLLFLVLNGLQIGIIVLALFVFIAQMIHQFG